MWFAIFINSKLTDMNMDGIPKIFHPGILCGSITYAGLVKVCSMLSSRNLRLIRRFRDMWFWLIYSPERLELWLMSDAVRKVGQGNKHSPHPVATQANVSKCDLKASLSGQQD